MKTFSYINASTIDEAVLYLNQYKGKASLIAGGTDILGTMKDRILPGYPEALINLKAIPGFDTIQEEKEMLEIGPMAILEDIAHHETIKTGYTALAQAARKTASPHIREMGTLGGNICQDIRCWYYRNPENRFPCLRKGGGRCYALKGDPRYHSIFGGSVKEGCIAVHPSDTAPALIALDARIKTSKRNLAAEDFFQVEVSRTTVLEKDEIVTGIQIPKPEKNTKSAFFKFALRKSIDFSIVNCAAMITCSGNCVEKARICLNAVHVKPYRARAAEEVMIGKEISEAIAEAAGQAAVAGAKPLPENGYMVLMAKALVKKAILACK